VFDQNFFPSFAIRGVGGGACSLLSRQALQRMASVPREPVSPGEADLSVGLLLNS